VQRSFSLLKNCGDIPLTAIVIDRNDRCRFKIYLGKEYRVDATGEPHKSRSSWKL
jgi:hypothetical protein